MYGNLIYWLCRWIVNMWDFRPTCMSNAMWCVCDKERLVLQSWWFYCIPWNKFMNIICIFLTVNNVLATELNLPYWILLNSIFYFDLSVPYFYLELERVQTAQNFYSQMLWLINRNNQRLHVFRCSSRCEAISSSFIRLTLTAYIIHVKLNNNYCFLASSVS